MIRLQEPASERKEVWRHMRSLFKDYLNRMRPEIEAAFKEQLSEIMGDLPFRDGGTLRRALEGGKKIRGALLFMLNETLGGSLEAAMPRAIAVELIHSATLLHDDYVDQHVTRRDMPAAWTIEGARKAVLLGDVIFASAIKMMSELSHEDGWMISHAIAQVSRGALQEVLDPILWRGGEMESGPMDERFYRKIIYLKTGVLFGVACRLGAVAARADRKTKDRAQHYGTEIGEAYQIADDLMEVRRFLSTGILHPGETANLAAALVYFSGGVHPCLSSLPGDRPLELGGDLAGQLEVMAQKMAQEVDRRLHAAAEHMVGRVPEGDSRDLVHSAPWELIEIFNGS
jgi:geranylgeranyl pyrophosphate synthase